LQHDDGLHRHYDSGTHNHDNDDNDDNAGADLRHLHLSLGRGDLEDLQHVLHGRLRLCGPGRQWNLRWSNAGQQLRLILPYPAPFCSIHPA